MNIRNICQTLRIGHGISIALIACAALSTPLLSQAQQTDDEENQETPLQLPAAPQASQLLTFYQNGAQTFMLDPQSLTLTKEGIIRFSLVAISSSGAKNISYEGIRCETGEKKLYAIGRNDGMWIKTRNPNWTRIYGNSFNNHHSVLAYDYFCEGSTIAGKPERMIERIKRRESLRP